MENRRTELRMEPEALGPLKDRPLVELAKRSSPGDLYPGASLFLSDRHQRRRAAQWDLLRPVVAKLVRPDERVLYVAFAHQAPPILDTVGLGHLAMAYHQVLLMFTDQRVVEVILDARGNKPGTRIRSCPLAQVKEMKLSFGRLLVTPTRGSRMNWRLPIGGDRKILDLLLPRLKQRCATGPAAPGESLPLWHCPRCAAVVPPKPMSCASCHVGFRTLRTASLLSLAFPGAGVLYAGHPFVAFMDFCTQVMMVVVTWFMVASSSAKEGLLPGIIVGALLLGFTKLASLNVGRILVQRAIPDDPARSEKFRKWAVGGAIASALVVAVGIPTAGMAQPRLEHDLDASGGDGAWTGTRRAADFGVHKDNGDARSRWTNRDGAHVTVFAYPGGLLDDPQQFRRQNVDAMTQQGFKTVVEDDRVPDPFNGFRYIGELTNKGGQLVAVVNYFLYDPKGNDVHQVAIAVAREDADAGDAVLRDFLAHARWIEATPPER